MACRENLASLKIDILIDRSSLKLKLTLICTENHTKF